MKKALLLLFIPVLFVQCSTSDEDIEEKDQQEKIEELTISIIMDGDVLQGDREKILYISSEEGIIEGQLSLVNNQKNTLSIKRKTGVQYYAIIHDKETKIDGTIHYFKIFEKVQSADYTIKAFPVNGGTNGEIPKVDLNIVNAGNLRLIGRTGGGWSSTLSSINGGTFTLANTCKSKPGDYFASFKNSDEPYGRYFWTENLEADQSFSLDYEELPLAPAVQTQLPEHDYASIFVYAFHPKNPNLSYLLGYGISEGMETYESYVPEENIFNNFIFNVNLYKGTVLYTSHSFSEVIPSSIQLPSFDFTFNNFSIDNTNYTTTGSYDVGKATYLISNGNILKAEVEAYSEPGSTVSFSINTLIHSLFKKVDSLDPAELEAHSVTLSSYDYLENYTQAVKKVIESQGSLPTGKNSETVRRLKQ